MKIMDIHVFNPGAETDNHMCQNLNINIHFLSLWSSVSFTIN